MQEKDTQKQSRDNSYISYKYTFDIMTNAIKVGHRNIRTPVLIEIAQDGYSIFQNIYVHLYLIKQIIQYVIMCYYKRNAGFEIVQRALQKVFIRILNENKLCNMSITFDIQKNIFAVYIPCIFFDHFYNPFFKYANLCSPDIAIDNNQYFI